MAEEQQIFGMSALYCKKHNCVLLDMTSEHAAISLPDFIDFVRKLMGILAQLLDEHKRALPCGSMDCTDRSEECGIPPELMSRPPNLS